MAIIKNGGITSTVALTLSRKPGDFVNGNDLRKNTELVYLDSALVNPIDFVYGIPVKLTSSTTKYIDGKRIVVKALANTPVADIVGFIKISEISPELFLKSGNLCSIFKGAEAYNQFYPYYVDDALTSTIKAGDKLEFVPATNSYKPVTTGTPVVVATVDGGYAVQPLI